MSYIKEELKTKKQKEEYIKFLDKHELDFEETDYSILLLDNNRIIGTASLGGNTIKLIAIDSDYQGMGLTSTLVSDIKIYAKDNNIEDLFIFTKPTNEYEFNKLGFNTIIKTKEVLFLEENTKGISSYVKSLEKEYVKGKKIGSIVMNLNPFTLGHKYLIEQASSACDHVHIFIVKEDKSVFPYKTRLKLLKAGTKEFKNITIHEGSDYIISSSTFPTYFLKDKANIPSIYARLDAMIFSKYIAKTLDINVRYVGTEPYSKTTKMYNDSLEEILSKDDIKVIELDRLEIDNEVVSASTVRKYIREDNLNDAFKLLPDTTIEFLKSDEGTKIIEKIKKMPSDSRH